MEVSMSSTPRDYSIFDRFNFERKPVGVKFLPLKPEGIERTKKSLNFCEMFKEAQTSRPFYVQREDFHCVEPILLGMEESGPMGASGLIGEMDGIFEEARANRRIYQHLPHMQKDSIAYVAFSAIDQLTFDPDVLIVTANASQASLILRAPGYSTGDPWSCKSTPIAACSWLYIYPVVSGEMNFTVTGFSLGMRALKVLPEGLILISIPWIKLPTVMENLQKMAWTPKSDTVTGEEHKKRFEKLLNEIKQRTQNQ
jgi:uncharacterized protein (DUF169 family)